GSARPRSGRRVARPACREAAWHRPCRRDGALTLSWSPLPVPEACYSDLAALRASALRAFIRALLIERIASRATTATTWEGSPNTRLTFSASPISSTVCFNSMPLSSLLLRVRASLRRFARSERYPLDPLCLAVSCREL